MELCSVIFPEDVHKSGEQYSSKRCCGEGKGGREFKVWRPRKEQTLRTAAAAGGEGKDATET